MTLAQQSAWEQLLAHLRQGTLIGSVESVLSYDEQTVMPAGAAEYRGEQLAWISGVQHAHATNPRIGEWLAELEPVAQSLPADSDVATTVREARRDYRQRTQLPQQLVEELARTKVAAQHAWVAARKAANFAEFSPWLEKMIRLKQEEAAALLPVLTPVGNQPAMLYDALLDQYEPGARVADVSVVLSNLRRDLVPLIRELLDQGQAPSADVLHREYPVAAQAEFGRAMAARIGFDFNCGRLDVTAHPFCSEMGPHDTRITTRYNPHAFNEAFFGILHESGHGLYDQGLRADWYGLGPGQYLSLGIHESQSRMWENLVGRSHAFWEFAWPLAQQAFPATLSDVTLETFYRAINRVEPSFIRVEADEATYNLHIAIRFELEQALLHGELKVADLPAAWNERYQTDLGITPPNAAMGCLQDIHWSSGLFGYFATYSLGNLYASQFFAAAERDLGNLSEQFRRGEFATLLTWLRQRIHHSGRNLSAAELVQKVTGEPLKSEYLLEHLRGKYRSVYGLR
jgi:carboxypeptidase Taq